jgi:hypothetical protein
MTDQKIYRIAGISGLASIFTCFIEFPFYFVRTNVPGLSESSKYPDYAARNATNIMSCVFLDLIILALLMVFFAGIRHLIRKGNPQHEWLASLFFGVGLVFVTITFVSDSFQGTIVIDAFDPPANGAIMRALTESMLLLYGSIALWLLAFFMVILSYVTQQSSILPRWSAWVGYACALIELAYVPTMFVHHVDFFGWYNPACLGAEAFANSIPLFVWTIVIGILMIRKREPVRA